jgi:hypothetical protein
MIPRRDFLRTLAAACAVAPLAGRAAAPEPFRLRHVLASALYGELPLADILPEVAKVGAEGIDLWCKVHGNQREQADALGDDAFAALLARHRVRLIASTRYPLGPFGLQPELAWLRTAAASSSRAAVVRVIRAGRRRRPPCSISSSS